MLMNFVEEPALATLTVIWNGNYVDSSDSIGISVLNRQLFA